MVLMTDDLRTNLILTDDQDGTGQPANSEHTAQHNLINAWAKTTEAALGTVAPTLQSIYDNGATSADSIIAVDDTRDGLIVRDAATPITPTALLSVQTNAAADIFKVASDGLTASQPLALSAGISSSAAGTNSERYGAGATAVGDDGLAVGKNATASGDQSTAVGVDATATAIGASSFGQSADATGASSTAIGKNALASASAATALGEDSSATQTDSTALGKGSSVTGLSAIAIGSASDAQGVDAVCIGSNAQVTQDRGIGIGKNITVTVTTSESESVAIGHASASEGGFSVALGTGSSAGGSGSVSAGSSSSASGAGSVALGPVCQATGARSLAIGDSASATGDDSISVGSDAVASHDRSVAIGDAATTTANDQVRLGVVGSNVNVPGTTTLTGAVTTGASITAAGNILASPGNIGAINAGLVLNTMENSTLSNANLGRIGSYGFFGRTAGDSLHALANMVAHHSGAGADQRGMFYIGTNDGADGTNPTKRLSVDFDGATTLLIDTGAKLRLEKTSGGNGVELDHSAATGVRAVVFSDRNVTVGQDTMILSGGVASLAASQTDTPLLAFTASGPMVGYLGEVARATVQPHAGLPVGATCVVELWINGAATGTTTTVSQVNPTRNVSWTNALAAGDRVQLKATTNVSWTTQDLDVALYVQQDRP